MDELPVQTYLVGYFRFGQKGRVGVVSEAVDGIESIYLVYRPFNKIIWSLDLRTLVGQEQPELPFFAQPTAPTNVERRVTIKSKPQTDKTKEG